MLILTNFTLLVEGLFYCLLFCTFIVCTQLVIKIIRVLVDDMKKDLKNNHNSSMAAQSVNLANEVLSPIPNKKSFVRSHQISPQYL